MKIKLTHMWRKRERKKKSKRKGRENAKHENYRHTFRNYFAWQINLLYDCITSFIVLQTERKELFDPFFVYCSMLRIFSRIINRRRCMNERWTKKITAQRIYYTFAMLALAENFVNQRQWFKCGMRSSPKCMFIDCKWGHTHTRSHTFSHAYTIPGKKWSTGAKSNVAAAAIEPISVSIEPKNIIFYKQFINSSNIRGLMCSSQSFDQFPNGWIANMRCIYLHLQMPFYIFGKIY